MPEVQHGGTWLARRRVRRPDWNWDKETLDDHTYVVAEEQGKPSVQTFTRFLGDRRSKAEIKEAGQQRMEAEREVNRRMADPVLGEALFFLGQDEKELVVRLLSKRRRAEK